MSIESCYPRVIFMCNKTISEAEKDKASQWKDMNPAFDVELYDDTKIREFLLSEYGARYVKTFDFIQHGPIRADFWRLCVLYKHGGFYSDIDNVPLVPLSTFIESDVDLVTCSSYWRYKFNPNFIAVSQPGNFIMKKCIDWYLNKHARTKSYQNNVKCYWEWSIMQAMSDCLQLSNYDSVSPGIFNTMGSSECKMRVQIIQERQGKSHYDDHNVYKNIRVFNNRSANWDHDTHSFINK